MPLTAGDNDQITGLKLNRLMPGEVQPARAGEHQVEFGYVGPVDLEPPWLAEFRQAVHGAAHPQRPQQFGDRVVGGGVQSWHGQAFSDARTSFLSFRT